MHLKLGSSNELRMRAEHQLHAPSARIDRAAEQGYRRVQLNSLTVAASSALKLTS